MLVCDTSGLVAYFDASDAHNAQVSRIIEADPGPFVVSPYVVAELDYLLATRRGVAAQLTALAELSGGAWELPCIATGELNDAAAVIDKYRDQKIGVADASLVVLARRYRTDRILTLDQRHFRVIRTAAGGPFTVLPEVA
ncbi:MAG: PIN domain-containing protein [Candidatus Dormiibacterota bacterium]